MRRVDVEEAAAVGAELLDRDLRGRRPERQGLLLGARLFHDRLAVLVGERLAVGAVLRLLELERLLHQIHRLVGREGLHHALRDEDPGEQERQRQQNVQGRAGQVGPDVADAVRLLAREAARERDQHRHAGRRREEVLHAEPQHLREIAHRRLAAVALPVGVGDEAHCGVERRVRRNGAEFLGIEWKQVLQSLQRVDGSEADEVEPEHTPQVALPVHLLFGPHPGRAVDEALQRREEPAAAFVHVGHVGTERLDEQDKHAEVDGALQERVHQKSSGLRSA